LTFVEITVVKYLIQIFYYISLMMSIDMTLDLMADMVNPGCVRIRRLNALCPALVLFDAYTVDLFASEGYVNILTCFLIGILHTSLASKCRTP